MQGDDGLAGAWASADPGRAGVLAADQLLLGGMEEDLPTPEVAFFEDAAERFVVGDDDGLGAVDGRLPVLGVKLLRGGDGDRFRDILSDLLEGDAVAQPQQDFTSVPGAYSTSPRSSSSSVSLRMIGMSGSATPSSARPAAPYSAKSGCPAGGAEGTGADSGAAGAGRWAASRRRTLSVTTERSTYSMAPVIWLMP